MFDVKVFHSTVKVKNLEFHGALFMFLEHVNKTSTKVICFWENGQFYLVFQLMNAARNLVLYAAS